MGSVERCIGRDARQFPRGSGDVGASVKPGSGLLCFAVMTNKAPVCHDAQEASSGGLTVGTVAHESPSEVATLLLPDQNHWHPRLLHSSQHELAVVISSFISPGVSIISTVFGFPCLRVGSSLGTTAFEPTPFLDGTLIFFLFVIFVTLGKW